MSTDALSRALEVQRDRLMPCVHCGFCLPACPTYNRLGDEADSPRGRLHLMKAVVEGRLDPGAEAFQTHIDRCLGCRACEPVCPSGVEYGTLLEAAREVAREARPPSLMQRALLATMGSRAARGAFFLIGRVLRALRLPKLGAALLPGVGPLRSARLGLAMLAATGRPSPNTFGRGHSVAPPTERGENGAPPRGHVVILEGCVQRGLFARIQEATVRTLEANGYRVSKVVGQDCCGALHAHGGDAEGARRLARRNIEAFERSDADWIVVNAAGCGAAMKDYGKLFEGDADAHPRAIELAARVRDVVELLEEAGPRPGASLPGRVAYDHPCHLLHAQGVRAAPLTVLSAIPDLEVEVIADADECCGGAGIYGMTHPDLGGRIGRDKVAAVRAADADAACTPNPGCMMQIGAGLLLEGSTTPAMHPVELLDLSYARAGLYTGAEGPS